MKTEVVMWQNGSRQTFEPLDDSILTFSAYNYLPSTFFEEPKDPAIALLF
ncbi:MAG: hypothetical protein F6K45_07600 [Kamptonema sp. SIO1D9]|nr:hypothetical protein [Kamptonema sp. SIO1D9]